MKNKINAVLGLIQIILSVYWIYEMILVYYKYHYTDILFAFMYPDWVLVSNIIEHCEPIFWNEIIEQKNINQTKLFDNANFNNFWWIDK